MEGVYSMFEMILFFNELMLQSISLPLMLEDRGIFALTLYIEYLLCQ
jgi:hypothetical protein